MSPCSISHKWKGHRLTVMFHKLTVSQTGKRHKSNDHDDQLTRMTSAGPKFPGSQLGGSSTQSIPGIVSGDRINPPFRSYEKATIGRRKSPPVLGDLRSNHGYQPLKWDDPSKYSMPNNSIFQVRFRSARKIPFARLPRWNLHEIVGTSNDLWEKQMEKPGGILASQVGHEVMIFSRES